MTLTARYGRDIPIVQLQNGAQNVQLKHIRVCTHTWYSMSTYDISSDGLYKRPVYFWAAEWVWRMWFMLGIWTIVDSDQSRRDLLVVLFLYSGCKRTLSEKALARSLVLHPPSARRVWRRTLKRARGRALVEASASVECHIWKDSIMIQCNYIECARKHRTDKLLMKFYFT